MEGEGPLQHRKNGGRKPAANAKAAASKPAAAAAAKNKRGVANKQQTQLWARHLGISPEKKVRKMMPSPFNKKSGSMLSRSTGEDGPNET